ncbi:hypothetical protein JAAARDRAFT_527372 [Jaapia argillacea MUCL 33604]|uniref:Protein kinase domain-containing protein n=1 Tax=Jaapia argillacea MUCL 33604 TaxID=933084 RepID=A0A067QHA2_9AGAM|nr:hypothetical protein JAAARDRAFT_527372 [Jaapia argillacea MUCL 33604]
MKGFSAGFDSTVSRHWASLRDTKHQLVVTGDNPCANGGSSDIYQGQLIPASTKSEAIKTVCVKIPRGLPNQNYAGAHREIKILRNVNHTNIVDFMGVSMSGARPSIVLVWYGNGDALSFLYRNPQHSRRSLIIDVLRGLKYLHMFDPPIAHGDLKGRNILISDDLRAVISDFGASRMLDGSDFATTAMGSARWLGPEFFSVFVSGEVESVHDEAPTLQSDIWAFACVVGELITGEPPFVTKPHNAQVVPLIVRGVPPYQRSRLLNSQIPEGMEYSERIWKALESCWNTDPAMRPTVGDLEALL